MTAPGSEIGHPYLDVFSNHPHIVSFTNGTLPCIYWTSTEASAEEAERFPNVPLPGPVLSWPVHDGDVAAQIRSNWMRNIFTSIARVFRG